MATYGKRPIDPSTGLPAVAENQFWRVVESEPGSMHHYIKLMENSEELVDVGIFWRKMKMRRKLREVRSHPIPTYKFSEQEIIKSAEYILYKEEQEAEKRASRARIEAERKLLFGDFKSKKTEN